jgi:HTH-type transcriptional regulator/antitoxin MqsA
MSRCPICKSETLAEQRVRTTLEYQGRTYIFDNVPAEVCSQCGEILLRLEIAKQLERLMRVGTAPDCTEVVPVYDLAAVA